MLFLLIIAVSFAILLYRYYERQKHYFSSRGIPGPPAEWLIGNIRKLWFNGESRNIVLRDWTKQYGKVYGLHEGQRKVLVISDYNMLNEILVKQFENFHARMRFIIQREGDGPKTHLVEASGTHWKRLRALGTYAFTNRAMKQIKGTIDDSAMVMTNELAVQSLKGEVNILDFFQEYTMDIISKVALGQKDVKMFHNPYLAMCRDVFTSPLSSKMNTIPACFPFLSGHFFTFIENVGKLIGIEFVRLMEDIETAVAKRKKEREAGCSTSTDFIDMFLDAEVDESQVQFGEEANVSKKMLFDEVVQQCLVLLLAGFETTSNSLAYLSHFFANYPQVQEKCREEIDALFPDDELDYDTLAEMKYTEAAIKESLRHYPLASFVVTRTCMSDTEVCGMKIEKGQYIQTDTWSMHMDPEIWGEDAEEFRPERWLEDNDRARVAFQAFGEGPRMCIGMRLAYLEEKIAVATLLKRFVIEKSENTNPLRLLGPFSTYPEKVMVNLRERKA